MSSNFGYIDIILLAMIAGFIILRLRSILGRKTGHEDKIYPRFSEKKFEEFKNLQEVKFKKKNSNELEGEEKEKFIKGAEIAYETIITAFAKGDKKSLKGHVIYHQYIQIELLIDLPFFLNLNLFFHEY